MTHQSVEYNSVLCIVLWSASATLPPGDFLVLMRLTLRQETSSSGHSRFSSFYYITGRSQVVFFSFGLVLSIPISCRSNTAQAAPQHHNIVFKPIFLRLYCQKKNDILYINFKKIYLSPYPLGLMGFSTYSLYPSRNIVTLYIYISF